MDTNPNENPEAHADHLMNLHLILNAAAQSNPLKLNDMTALKIPKELKLRVAEICLENGTTISAFLRTCCEVLVAEYVV